MSAPKVTPWIDGDPLPDRPGWYELRYAGKRMANPPRAWWDGYDWRYGPGNCERGVGSFWNDQFRGLTAPHKG